ncbi:RNA-directed DNA polymerase (reverse transcriptase)-related family protein [Rhynchospora pubera]|uniref:RNA-directed DNA polymerase (Reverse transcriptase)-related family protein n=1 Tax=Rhynchospora pubera TaxID=906938 RepID=A0AAV8FI70_9POAL|nr:RNA-directed DNA polymerase (reverse transcriptase)-related family protein [Rhynchospora pubera]
MYHCTVMKSLVLPVWSVLWWFSHHCCCSLIRLVAFASSMLGCPNFLSNIFFPYSSASTYCILADPGLRTPYHSILWKLKVPPKVRIFLWLVLLDRILTQQNLMLRNWPSISECKCCSTDCLETSVHLFITCDFAKQIWTLVRSRFNLPPLSAPPDLLTFWTSNRTVNSGNWDVIWAASIWAIWKERNRRVFSSCSLPPTMLMAEICATIEAWKRIL